MVCKYNHNLVNSIRFCCYIFLIQTNYLSHPTLAYPQHGYIILNFPLVVIKTHVDNYLPWHLALPFGKAGVD